MDDSDLQALSPLFDPTESPNGTQPQECLSLSEQANDYPPWVRALAKRMDGLDAKFDMIERRFDEMERKIIGETEKRLDEMVDKKFTEHKTKLLDELKANMTERVEEEVQMIKDEVKFIKDEIKDEMRCEIRRVEQKCEKDYNELCQWIAENEGERYSTKIILSGDAIPPIREDESPMDVAKNLIQNQLRIPTRDNILSAVRFGTSPTGIGQHKPKILVELRDIRAKRDIVDAALQIRSAGLFINELLPKKTNELFFEVRKLKREKKIQVAYTKDGVIRVRKTREGTMRKIFTKRDLEKFIIEAQIH